VYDEIITEMVRTNVVVDEELIRKVMRLYRLSTKREAIDFALRRAAGEHDRRRMLEMRGTGWEGDLDEMRRSRVADL
jgi:Arc/MetJ family transcription regulator